MSEMDNLSQLLDHRLSRLTMLNDFITIFGERTKLMDRLVQIRALTDDNLKLVAQCKSKVNEARAELLPSARRELDRMDRMQLSMLNMLDECDRRADDSGDARRSAAVVEEWLPDNGGQRSAGKGAKTAGGKENAQAQQTPRRDPSTATSLLLSDYKDSPFARRMRPAALKFIDFECSLSAGDFARIPAYMRGRETHADLEAFLDGVIVRCFTEKYTLFHKRRECVKHPQQMTLWKHYRQQADYFPKRTFITSGDIAHITGRLVDKKTLNRIAMLRHLQVLQEQRHQSTVCYLWMG